MNTKLKNNSFNEYKTTLILLSILLIVMSLVIFIPLKRDKQADNINVTNYSK